jgi:preprotein translocase subunit Sec63
VPYAWPLNAIKYEWSIAAREDKDFNKDKTLQFSLEYKPKDVKVNKKSIHKKRELLRIINLAYNCDLIDLKPKNKGKRGKLPPFKI